MTGLRAGASGWNRDFNAQNKGWKDLDRSWRLLFQVFRRSPQLFDASQVRLLEVLIAPQAAISQLSGKRFGKEVSPAASLELLLFKEQTLRAVRNILEHNREPELQTHSMIEAVTSAGEVWCSDVEDALRAVPARSRAEIAECVPQELRAMKEAHAAELTQAIDREMLAGWQRDQLARAEKLIQTKRDPRAPIPDGLFATSPNLPSRKGGKPFAQLFESLPLLAGVGVRGAVAKVPAASEPWAKAVLDAGAALSELYRPG
jgi:hypothetical protein